MLFGLGAKTQFVDQVDHVPQAVTALQLVFDLAEDFADLVFDGIGTAGPLLESGEIGEQFDVDEVTQVIAGQCYVVVDLSRRGFGCGPSFPPIGCLKNEAVGLALKLGLGSLVMFKRIKVFQEQQPG